MTHPASKLATVAACLALATLAGCDQWITAAGFGGPSGELTLASSAPDADVLLTGDFDTAVYAADGPDSMHAILIDGTIDAPEKVVHLQLLWRPRAGKTPFDPAATNTIVRYVLFGEDGSAALYGGGGMMHLHDTVGEDRFTGSLRLATLRLLDASENYDPGELGDNAISTGRFTATRDDHQTAELLRRISVHLEARLGYPRFVRR